MSSPTADEIASRAASVTWLVLDVDGVLTDGSVLYSDEPAELKRFHVRDGSGLKFWRDLGNRAAIVSGRSSASVDRRARELGIAPVLQGRSDKAAALAELIEIQGLRAETICAIGDDLPDLAVMNRVGLAIAVADACEEVRQAAHYVTRLPGGRGAVREAIEWLLKLRDQWGGVVAKFR